MNGTIDRRPDRPKQWRARYIGPDKKQRSRAFVMKRDAEGWLRDELGKLDRGVWLDPAGGKRPYAEHADDWISGTQGIKEKTRAGYVGLLRSRVLPVFGSTRLRRIHPADVRAWIAAMVDEGLSPSRIRQAHQVLRASLDQAVKDGLLAKNPARDVSLPKSNPRRMTALTMEQAQALSLLAEDHQPGAGMLVTLLSYAGIRWGEAVALRGHAVDPLHQRLNITTAATEVNGHLVVGTPKTHRIRTIVLPRVVADALSVHMARTAVGPDDLVFTTPRGGPLRSANFWRRVWVPSRRTLAVAHPGLDSLRVHDLRHTAASIAISCGANIMAVQRMLGHEKASVTLDVYGHLYTEDLEQLADRIDDRLRGVA